MQTSAGKTLLEFISEAFTGGLVVFLDGCQVRNYMREKQEVTEMSLKVSVSVTCSVLMC